MPGAQSRYIRHECGLIGLCRQMAGVGGKIDRRDIAFVALSDFPGQIVVPIDQRRLQQHLIDAMLIIIRRPSSQWETQHQTENAKHRHGGYSSKVISIGSIPAIIPRTV